MPIIVIPQARRFKCDSPNTRRRRQQLYKNFIQQNKLHKKINKLETEIQGKITEDIGGDKQNIYKQIITREN